MRVSIIFCLLDRDIMKFCLTDEPAHMFFWEKVLRFVAKEYKIDTEHLKTHYMGVPRGRVQKEIDHIEYKPTGNYIILHGGDVPVSTIQYAVLQDFGLNELNRAGKVKWVVNDHEKMDPEDRKEFLDSMRETKKNG